MKTIDWKLLVNKLGVQIKKHSPEILTGIGIAGMITTTVLAVKATPEAMRRIEQKKREEHHKTLTAVQTVQAAGVCYIPAAVTGAASIACLVGASAVNGRRNAALATAYSLAETSLRDYKARVIETIGEKQEAKIQEKLDSERLTRNPPPDHAEAAIADGYHHELCYDAMFGRYFYSDRAEIERVVNLVNKRMTYGGETYVSLNEFYGELGLGDVEIGDLVGWNISYSMIETDFDSALVGGQRPCLVMRFKKPPIYDYDVC